MCCLCFFVRVFTDRQQGPQTSDSVVQVFSPYGQTTSPWKQHFTKTELGLAEGRASSGVMQKVYQTFTGSSCFLLKPAIKHLHPNRLKAEHTVLSSWWQIMKKRTQAELQCESVITNHEGSSTRR